MKTKTKVKAGVSAGAIYDWIKGIVTGEPHFDYPTDSAVC